MIKIFEVTRYDPSVCAVFKKTAEKYGGLSNMAGGYPITVNGVTFRISEALYQCMRFGSRPDVQEKIIKQASPMAAKMVGKPFLDQSRPDWLEVRQPIMWWTLQLKLLQNFVKFGDLLLSTGHMDIVENSHKDSYWGAIPQYDGTLVGRNTLGNMLLTLRTTLIAYPEILAKVIVPVEGMLILGQPVPEVILLEDILHEKSDNFCQKLLL